MNYFSNGWNWCWVAWGVIGYWGFYFNVFQLSSTTAIFITLVSTLFKEILDEIASIFHIEIMFKIGFDPAGFDLRDLGMTFAGIILGFIAMLI